MFLNLWHNISPDTPLTQLPARDPAQENTKSEIEKWPTYQKPNAVSLTFFKYPEKINRGLFQRGLWLDL